MSCKIGHSWTPIINNRAHVTKAKQYYKYLQLVFILIIQWKKFFIFNEFKHDNIYIN